MLENLLLSHFVLGRLRLRRGEDADRGGRARTYTQTQTPPFRTKWRCDNDVYFTCTLLAPGRAGTNIPLPPLLQQFDSPVCFHAVPLSRSHPAATVIVALPGRRGTGKEKIHELVNRMNDIRSAREQRWFCWRTVAVLFCFSDASSEHTDQRWLNYSSGSSFSGRRSKRSNILDTRFTQPVSA